MNQPVERSMPELLRTLFHVVLVARNVDRQQALHRRLLATNSGNSRACPLPAHQTVSLYWPTAKRTGSFLCSIRARASAGGFP